MKKKKVNLILMCIVLIANLLGCGNQMTAYDSNQYQEAEKSEDDSAWEMVETGEVSIDNDRLSLVLDSETTHFTIFDKINENKYFSAVTQKLQGAKIEPHAKSQSEMYITYFDENGQKQEMNSFQNSVGFDTHKVLKNEEKIRIYYTFQLKASSPFVPKFLTEDMFRTITEKMDSTSMFKFKLMYKYYAVDNITTDAKEIRAKYQYAEKHPVYILNSTNEQDMAVVSDYVTQAGYTQENYMAELKAINVTLHEEETPLQFIVPVEYCLTEEGFTAQILTDRITESGEGCTLYSVSILPYLNCGIVAEAGGYFMLPDGSGSLMQLAETDNAGYTQKIFGDDLACENQLTSTQSKVAVMPLMGYSGSQGGWLAYIEKGKAMATVNAFRAGDTEYCAHAYSEFALRGTDNYTMRKSTIAMAVFSKNRCVEQPKVHYVLLQKEASPMDMAKWYRNYLIETQQIDIEANKGELSVYLEFTGYITQKASFFGVSYDKKIVLSTLSDITESVNKLLDAGVKNIYVRLNSYAKNGGKYHSLVDGFSLEPKVGTIQELENLADLLSSNGGGLYLEDDLQVVYKDSMLDGFSSTKDVLRRLDKTLADYSDFDIVTGKNEDNINVRYLVSPKLYESLAEKFKTELQNEVTTNNINVSFAGAGQHLMSDFNTNNEYDRIQTEKALNKTMETLKGEQNFMTDVGNEYVLNQTEHILNMSLTDSNFICEDYAIPLYQMVLHGHIEYAGEAMNLSKNQDRLSYDTLLSGANVYYSCVTDKEALESLSGEQDVYPTAFDVVLDDIVDFYDKHQELYNIRCGREMTDFRILEEGLIMIEYADAVSVIFNSNEFEVTWQGQQIAGRDYWIVGK